MRRSASANAPIDQWVEFARALEDVIKDDVTTRHFLCTQIVTKYDCPYPLCLAGERVGWDRNTMDQLAFGPGRTDWERYDDHSQDHVDAQVGSGPEIRTMQIWPLESQR